MQHACLRTWWGFWPEGAQFSQGAKGDVSTQILAGLGALALVSSKPCKCLSVCLSFLLVGALRVLVRPSHLSSFFRATHRRTGKKKGEFSQSVDQMEMGGSAEKAG